jgi:GNAT superfamily N-acetyltransferase
MTDRQDRPSVAVRDATGSDAEIVARLNRIVQALHVEALPEYFKPLSAQKCLPEEFVRIMQEDDSFIGIAVVDQEPVGYIYAQFICRPEDIFRQAFQAVYIHHLVVLPEHRRLGIGRRLVDYVKQSACRRNVTAIGTDVWAFNRDARLFFERCGLSVINEKMFGTL